MRPLFGVLAALALLVGQMAYSQEPKSPVPGGVQVDTHEITRMGDRVAEVGIGHRDDGEALFSAAMAPPADDSDQWYVTLWGSSRDAATEAMRKAFEKDPNLAAYVAPPPGEGKRPWAHFNVYYADDPMQRFRFTSAKIPLTGPFPVVTINTPRDGSFGGYLEGTGQDGKKQQQAVIVDRIEASGMKPADVNKRLSASVKLWCKKLQESGFQPPPKVAKKVGGDELFAGTRSVFVDTTSLGSHGQPWGPTPPQQQPFNPVFPPGGPATVPTDSPTPVADLSALLKLLAIFIPNLSTILVLLVAVSNVWMLYREIAKGTGMPLLLDDVTAAKLIEFLKNLKSPGP